ncbi:MAG: formate dehydrogenase subunit delta [Pontibacterium sp.]
MSAQLQQLIHMANQIADNNRHHDSESEAVLIIANHLKRFWARSMKQQIVAYAQADGDQLNKTARAAIDLLADQYS